MAETRHTIDEIPALRERVRQLKLTEARYGISVEPHIPIERRKLERLLANVDEIQQAARLINTYRRNLEILLHQRALSGVSVARENQIAESRRQIQHYRRTIAAWGFDVPEDIVDEDPPEEPRGPFQASVGSSPTDQLREGLRDLETLIKHAQNREALKLVRQLQTLL